MSRKQIHNNYITLCSHQSNIMQHHLKLYYFLSFESNEEKLKCIIIVIKNVIEKWKRNVRWERIMFHLNLFLIIKRRKEDNNRWDRLLYTLSMIACHLQEMIWDSCLIPPSRPLTTLSLPFDDSIHHHHHHLSFNPDSDNSVWFKVWSRETCILSIQVISVSRGSTSDKKMMMKDPSEVYLSFLNNLHDLPWLHPNLFLLIPDKE